MSRNLNETLGKLLSFEENKHGIQLKADNATVEVIVYNDAIINIQVCKDGQEAGHSYALVAEAIPTSFSVENKRDKIILKTPKIVLEILKKQIRFSFFTLDGTLINEDDKSFGCSWLGTEATVYKKLQADEKFIGLGEKTRGINRRGQAYVNWNTDSFAYRGETDPLYVSTPFYIGIHNDQPYGIFFDNPHKTTFNFGAGNDRFAYFSAEDGIINYYFIYDTSIAKIIQNYAQLTGFMPMQPKWSLGFQQCRYSYYPDTEVMNIAQNFRERKIPIDVLYLDIHYMDAYKVFTWDKSRFPNPKKMLANLKKMGIQTVVIMDPGIKVEESYKTYKSGMKNDVFVKYPDDSCFTAGVWPGDCHFPDYTNPKVRKWWSDQMKEVFKVGLEGFWNDMNEPAVWGKEIPALIEFDYEGEKASHKKAHNVYGLQMARATFEGTQQHLKKKRAFVLTRSGYSGIQRYAAVWTGDNVATDDDMLLGVRMVCSMGLTGMPFAGYDVGGFVGDADKNLYIRWMSIASFAPFFRSHSMINTRSGEPWTFGEEAEENVRNYINLRYRLMPYIYSAFYEASQTAMPIARSLTIDYPLDSNIYRGEFENEYLFGPSFLVCAVKSTAMFSKMYLPKGEWYYLYKDNFYEGEQEFLFETPIDKLPIFVKGGSIIPMQSLTQSTAEKPTNTLDIHLYWGQNDHVFEYYEDDGTSFEFKKEQYCKRAMLFNSEEKSFTIEPKIGKYKSHFKKIKLYFHGFTLDKNVKVNGRNKKIKQENFEFIVPISHFDPWYQDPDTSKLIEDLPFVEFANTNESVQVEW